MSDNNIVVASFPSHAWAESAIAALKEAGFQEDHIRVAAAGSDSAMSLDSHKTPAFAAGHDASGAWEKVRSFFSGDAVEPYAGDASRKTINDSVVAPENCGAENLQGSIDGLSVSDRHVRYFGHRLASGDQGAVVAVKAMGREDEALEILEENGGDVAGDAAEFG